MEEKLVIVLHKCVTSKQLKQVHVQILINSMRDSNYLATKLISLSSHEISFDYANKVFLDLPNPSLLSCKALIKCSIGTCDKSAASAYNKMRKLDVSSDSFIFTYLLKSFASFRRLQSGEMVHGHVLKFGFVYDMFFINTLLDFYDKCGGGLLVVKKLFNEMPRRDAVSWKTVTRAYMNNGEVDCAISLLNPMRLTTWSSVVCGLVNDGDMDLANEVFERMPRRNSVSWNAMIQGFFNNSMFFEAFSVFDEMLVQGGRCKPNETTLIAMISVCKSKWLIEQGKWLASYIDNNKLLSVPLGNALIDMFVASGDFHNAAFIFKKMSKRCILTWRTMIVGLAKNGYGSEAIKLFDIMRAECGQKPDDAILLALLFAFRADQRLVGDGKELFSLLHLMVHDFGVDLLEMEYRTIIEIFIQVGWIEAALKLMECMRLEPLPSIWGDILTACRFHGYDDLVVSFITKICDGTSNDISHLSTVLSDMILKTRDKEPNDSNYLKLVLEPLTRNMSDEKPNDPNVEWLISELHVWCHEGDHDMYLDSCYIHARETPPPQKILKSLVRQLVLHVKSVFEEVDCFDS